MNFLKEILNEKNDSDLLTGTVSSVSPLQVKFYPGDDAINVKCLTSLLGLQVGSNVLLTKFLSKFIIIGIIGDPSDIEGDVSDNADDIDDLTPTWTNFTPSLTWTGTPPSSITKVGRYCKVDKLVHFAIDLNSADGNGATGLKIDLPVSGQTTYTIHYMFPCTQWCNVWNDSIVSFYNPALGTDEIEFRNLNTFINGAQWYLFVSGFYESAS